MRLLLDTHVALWAVTDHPKLSNKARELIEDLDNEVIVSAASVWEIAIKHALGRGDMPVSAEAAVRAFVESGYTLLDVTAQHAAHVDRLPPLHQDPFDRILAAQALVEPLKLLTRDATLVRYSPSFEAV